MSQTEVLERLERWPRAVLANLPTPLVPAPRLASDLGQGPVYLKMDAETGFALGGNKVRKLEFELAPERIADVDCLITAGGPQSNHCRVTAAFAARQGLRCVLVTQGPAPGRPSGNAMLHRLFGAEIEVVSDREEREPGMIRVAERIRKEGGRPLIVPIGASTGLGSLGYARAAVELVGQLDRLDDGCDGTVLFSSTSSGGTIGGLLLGLALLGRTDVHVHGVSADAPAAELEATSLRLGGEGAALLGCDPNLSSVPFEVDDSQVGDGYGIPTPESTSAIERFGELAGVVLDPTYTGKAAAGMLAWVARRRPGVGRRMVFLHTGGHPGLLT